METIPAEVEQFAICVCNDEYPVALEIGKLYPVLPDPVAAQHKLTRIIDESGEDYLYPQEYFYSIELPQSVKEQVSKARR